MGLFSGIKKKILRTGRGIIKTAIGGAIGGPIGGAIAGASSFAPSPSSSFASHPVQFGVPNLPARAPVLPAPLFGGSSPETDELFRFRRDKPQGYHLNKADGKYGKKGTYWVKNRHINPTNHKAAMRAARRLIGFRKAVMRTEKALRKAVPPSARRARRLPAGHHRHLSHD